MTRLRKLRKRAEVALVSISFAVVAALAATTQAGATDNAYTPAPPEAGTDIPKSVIKFGMRPYADNTFYYIGMKKGWFDQVGVTIDPAPYGLKVTDTNLTALLLNGQLDMSSEYCPLFLPTYKEANSLKCVAFTDNFLGFAILGNPSLHLKSFKDYIKEGKKFDEAIHLALAPLQGKILVGAPELSDRPFEEAVSNFAKVNWKLQVLDDPKSLVLAKAGREDFVNPEGAPITYTLIQSGWTDIIDVGDLYSYAPGGLDSPVEALVANVGVGANGDFVLKNPNSVLRFLSVVWRIIDNVKKDPSLYDVVAPYLNSVAGTNLDGPGVASTVKILDPFFTFDDDKAFYDDTKSILYYQNAWGAIIKNDEEHNIVPKGAATADNIVWGNAIWHQLVDYRNKTDELLKGLEGKTLDASKQDLVAKAKQYYEWRDYLDAFRFAKAASS